MFDFFKKRRNARSCKKCSYYDSKNKSCNATRFDNLKSFPFKNTTCKHYKKK